MNRASTSVLLRAYLACHEQGAVQYVVPDANQEVVMHVHAARFDQHKAVEQLIRDQSPFLYFSEWPFQHLDSITRRTGRVTKYVRIIDVVGLKIRQMNRDFQKLVVEWAKDTQDYYPQSLHAVYLVNAPKWCQVASRGLLHFSFQSGG
jgi:hypothetical protein